MLPCARSFLVLHLLLMQFAKDRNLIKVSRIVERMKREWPNSDMQQIQQYHILVLAKQQYSFS